MWQPLREINAPPLDGFDTGTFSASGLVVVVGTDIWFGAWTEPAVSSVPTPSALKSGRFTSVYPYYGQSSTYISFEAPNNGC